MKPLLEACLAAVLLALASVALASATIELEDGSRIEGEIRSIENGVYTVVSPSLGTVHVPQSNIARIVYGGSGANAANSPDNSSARNGDLARDVLQIQTGLAQDPEAMKAILSLQSDPQIQAILSDPAIVRAIQEGDYTKLLGNAKIQALESNARVKELLQQQEH